MGVSYQLILIALLIKYGLVPSHHGLIYLEPVENVLEHHSLHRMVKDILRETQYRYYWILETIQLSFLRMENRKELHLKIAMHCNLDVMLQSHLRRQRLL